MNTKDLLVALRAVNGFLRVDPSDGGPDSAAEVKEYEATGEALAKELQRRGHKTEVGHLNLTYVSYVKVYRVIE